jgi:hypothetical protein
MGVGAPTQSPRANAAAAAAAAAAGVDPMAATGGSDYSQDFDQFAGEASFGSFNDLADFDSVGGALGGGGGGDPFRQTMGGFNMTQRLRELENKLVSYDEDGDAPGSPKKAQKQEAERERKERKRKAKKRKEEKARLRKEAAEEAERREDEQVREGQGFATCTSEYSQSPNLAESHACPLFSFPFPFPSFSSSDCQE